MDTILQRPAGEIKMGWPHAYNVATLDTGHSSDTAGSLTTADDRCRPLTTVHIVPIGVLDCSAGLVLGALSILVVEAPERIRLLASPHPFARKHELLRRN